MSDTNEVIIEKWIEGLPSKNASGTLSTDGDIVRSYGVLVGVTKGGEKIGFNFRGASLLTAGITRHINLMERAGVKLEPPALHNVQTNRMKIELRKRGRSVSFD